MSDGDSKKVLAGHIILEEIKRSIDSMNFGNVTVKVHAGRVIQIEVTEMKRFEEPRKRK